MQIGQFENTFFAENWLEKETKIMKKNVNIKLLE